MKINGKRLDPSKINKYINTRLVGVDRSGVCLLDLLCMALEADGMPRPMDVSSKQWVAMNVGRIDSVKVHARGRVRNPATLFRGARSTCHADPVNVTSG